MENLHDKQSKVSEQECSSRIEFLHSRVKSWESEILSYANELADEIPASTLLGYMNEVIIFGIDAAKAGFDPKSVLETILSLNSVLYKAGTIIEIVGYIKRENAEIKYLTNVQPSTAK